MVQKCAIFTFSTTTGILKFEIQLKKFEINVDNEFYETFKVLALEQDVQNCSSDDPNFLERVQITSRAVSDLATALPNNPTRSQLDHRKIIGETLESKVKNVLETYSKKVAKFRKRGRLGKRPIKSKMVSRDEPEVSHSEPVDQEEEAFLAEALAIRQGLV